MAEAATYAGGIESTYSLLKNPVPTLQGKATQSALSLGLQMVIPLLRQAACFRIVENMVNSISMGLFPHSFCYTVSFLIQNKVEWPP